MTGLDSTALFSGRGLACRRGGRNVFEDLDFDLTPGGLLRLSGPNGSGKSSLLRLMAGLTPILRGTLLWQGQPVVPGMLARDRRLAYLGHADAVKPALSPIEILRFWGRLHGAVPDESALTAALAAFGLTRQAGLAARFLSAGQKRRLNLARPLILPVPLWLLDEPFASLDSAGTEALAAAIARHRAAGGMVVLSTHDALSLDETGHIALGAHTVRHARGQVAS